MGGGLRKKPRERLSQKQVIGTRYGLLTVVSCEKKYDVNFYISKCDCGGTRRCTLQNLRNAEYTSCGCDRPKRGWHIRKHGMSNSPTYKIWESMIARENGGNGGRFKTYVGVFVCRKWKKFEGFLEDMGERPNGLSLDRINPFLGYSKKNCRWTTMVVQSLNKRYCRSGKSKYRGVYWIAERKRWAAGCAGKRIGRFKNEIDAALARDAAVRKHYGKEARLNFPKKGEHGNGKRDRRRKTLRANKSTQQRRQHEHDRFFPRSI